MKGAWVPLVTSKLYFFYPPGTLCAGGRGEMRGVGTTWSIPALAQALALQPTLSTPHPTPQPLCTLVSCSLPDPTEVRRLQEAFQPISPS